MAQRFGASPEAWDHFADKLGLVADLLPVVSNPNAEISDLSKVKAIGKTPSVYNRERKVAGLPKWTTFEANEHLIQRWASEPDYGICIQTRSVRAFDIDVEDINQAQALAVAITQLVGPLPMRMRADSGKRLLAFTYHRPLTKRVVPVAGGMVELLADGQQFIAAGTHPKGAEYQWVGGLPERFPVITGEQLDKVWSLLTTIYATGEPRIAREKRAGSADPDLIVHDDVADWLVQNWETYDVGRDGQVFLACPFEQSHTTDSGPTATAYFPAGTGGYAQGHFVCLHAHCQGREDRDFLDETGYSLAQFSDLGADRSVPKTGTVVDAAGGSTALVIPAQRGLHGVDRGASVPEALKALDTNTPRDEWPKLVRTKGKIESTAENLFAALQHGGMIYRHIAYDTFSDNLMWAPFEQELKDAQWRNFNDADTVGVRIELERRGFKPMGKEMLRDAIYAAAKYNQIDTAIEWIGRLKWDGVPRIDTFAIDVWGWQDTPYSRAVSRYIWTALAGRVLVPGVRADMAPILVGAQGIKKTTAIQFMAPTEDAYAEIKLTDDDDDLSRKLRGKLVGELEELRGLNSRAIEEIKAFVSRRREAWVPKYKEFEALFWRRCILIGSTNEPEFLADPTGERRWLPGECGELNIEYLLEVREQLWAEGAVRFALNGVEWEDAERLAKSEHQRFKVADSWEHAIKLWLAQPGIDQALPMDKGYITTHEILYAALGISNAQQNRVQEQRVIKALKHLGFSPRDSDEGRVYVR